MVATMVDFELRSELLAMKSVDEELHTELSNAGACSLTRDRIKARLAE
jgi:hypothetical protein